MPTNTPTPTLTPMPAEQALIPQPAHITRNAGQFTLTATTRIQVPAGNSELDQLADYLAARLQPATGFMLDVVPMDAAAAPGIVLTLSADETLGDEGYELTVSPDSVMLSAFKPAGVFYGIQTLLQLLPSSINAPTEQPTPWIIPAVTIRDVPRFAWRGVMLDVGRHFFSVDDVKRLIDLGAAYKLNRLHLHLTDDQGWRIEIESWPKLAVYGGSTQVGGGPGGYYTQADYAEIVAYAAQHYMLVVPEIDMPGHTNAALAAYPELSCGDQNPKLYTGTEVGFSYLCAQQDNTYQFIDDVIRELAAITPGPYIHIGGDEAHKVSDDDYRLIIEQALQTVLKYGKQPVGWEEIAKTQLPETAIAQYWASGVAEQAARKGRMVIMSPAAKAYLDMKYEANTPLGLDWAGYSSVQDSYTWDPANMLPGVDEDSVAGVEAALWTETIQTMDDIEFMVFPRLAGIAEIGWSPQAGRGWNEYRLRLAEHGPRWGWLGVNFHRSPEVPWK